MQFTDGNRIDLGFLPISRLYELENDSLTIVLLDKDQCIKPFPPANDRDYLPKPPTAKQFFDCCNEFWWVSPYVAKGLWRREFTYARNVQEYVRSQLERMLTWYFGLRTQFSVAPGKLGKYLEKYLEPEVWEMLLKTYADGDYERTWQAHFMLGKLFRTIAIPVAEHYGYEYPYGDDERVSAYLEHIHSLPKS